MAENDYNIIKPVESLQNIRNLNSVKRREEQKKRQNLHEQNDQETEEELDQETDEKITDPEPAENKEPSDPDSTGIDYCA
ncbi:unnamed protein product [marine sediment metagenome]|uniref:Uncharacterized protein n=1 Tax=marine sediment metagenome TaxID=412755 RepID=X0WQ09_9ZZZZ